MHMYNQYNLTDKGSKTARFELNLNLIQLYSPAIL